MPTRGDREAVRESARYLRGVRPLDPVEIRDYVEGRPSTAAVRAHLRALALDLDLVERPDGTFVPVPEGPVEAEFGGVTALPDRHVDRVESLLVDAYGSDWVEAAGGDLRATIDRVKEDYYRGRPVEYDREVALAYAVYHLAGYYAAAQYVVDELGRDGLLGHRLRVLDVGAGVGGPALGLADYLPEDALLEYHAVEPSAAADVLETLLRGTGENVHATVHRTTAEAFDPGGDYDLVLFANVLSELDDPGATAARYCESVAADGTLALLSPADLETSIGLRQVERTLADDRGLAAVYAPTPRFWPGERPTDRGWSFDERPPVEVPRFQSRLARGAPDPERYRNRTVKFSWSLLRPDGRVRHDRRLDRGRVAAMADSDDHVTDRLRMVAAKLSHDLSPGEDANPLYKVSDGSEAVDHYAVLVDETSLNDRLRRADYGDPLYFDSVLCLWNDDEEAFNLVVDEETVVDPA
ncbi:MAG: small ribosomal subunit Rsm22 family protein [Halobacteriaceae archaeon]